MTESARGETRCCGVLLHPTSFPFTPTSGTFGAAARDWIDLLARSGVGLWQLLPLAPTDGSASPYSSPSGSALNPWLIDADDLHAEGYLTDADHAGLPGGSRDRLDPVAARTRAAGMAMALLGNWPRQTAERQKAFQHWRRRQRHWLVDHCRFMVLRRLHGERPWWDWPEPLAQRRPSELERLEQDHGDDLLAEALLQWHLDRQWEALQRRARGCGVRLVGDLPFYVAHDSADVWRCRGLFSVDRQGRLQEQSGVPPDYFSSTGQLWGTPVYQWSRHRWSGFLWWLARLDRQLELYDLLRLDHFRAFEAFWAVPGNAETAEKGQWQPSPGGWLLALFWCRCLWNRRLLEGWRMPLIAEDLGVITPMVEALRDRFALPGMKILQFAFDGNGNNAYLPANYEGTNWVLYTGTHDNATTLGWWRLLDEEARSRVAASVGGEVHSPGWQLLELGLASRASMAVVPLQDLLELGDEARFNTPGTVGGDNWSWRLQRPIGDLGGTLGGLGEMAARYGREGPTRARAAVGDPGEGSEG